MGSAFSTKGWEYHQSSSSLSSLFGNKTTATAGRRATWVMGFWVWGKSEIPLVLWFGSGRVQPLAQLFDGTTRDMMGWGYWVEAAPFYPWRGIHSRGYPLRLANNTHAVCVCSTTRPSSAAYTTHTSLDGPAISTHQSTLVLGGNTVSAATIPASTLEPAFVSPSHHLLHFCITAHEPKTFYIFQPLFIYIPLL